MRASILRVLALVALPFVAGYAQTSRMIAQPGAVIVEPPTIGALGVEWRIQGDDNRNATVALSWRRTGELTWRDGLPSASPALPLQKGETLEF